VSVEILSTAAQLYKKSHLRDQFSRLGAMPVCDSRSDRQTDGRTHDDSTYRASIASRGKNWVSGHQESSNIVVSFMSFMSLRCNAFTVWLDL